MKICSLLPSGTEILFALGLDDKIAGVTDLCDYPPEAGGKPVVSRSLIDTSRLSSAEVNARMQELLIAGKSPYELDIAWLHQEKPDLILTQDTCYICDVDASEVAQAVRGIQPAPQVLVLSPKTISDIFDTITSIGASAGVIDRAVELVAGLNNRVREVAEVAATASYRPRVVSIEGTDPLVAGGHWIPELKLLAGGRDDLFSPGCPAERLNWATIRSYDPELLLITPCSSNLDRSLKELSCLVERDGWWELTAVQSGQVYIIDHVYFSRPGPRIVDGLEIMAHIIHPDLFTNLIPPDTVLKLNRPSQGPCASEDIIDYFQPFP